LIGESSAGAGATGERWSPSRWWVSTISTWS